MSHAFSNIFRLARGREELYSEGLSKIDFSFLETDSFFNLRTFAIVKNRG